MKEGLMSTMSATRKKYFARLAGRCLVFILCVLLCIFHRDSFAVLDGMNFFKSFSPLHLLWVIWVVDLFLQIVPIRNKVPLGSQKLFANRFKPIREKINHEALRNYIVSITKAAYKVFILWCLLITAIGLLYYFRVISKVNLFMISVFFYVWELCVMMYPERFWDHSNAALQCGACTDKLCTQYCHKLRP